MIVARASVTMKKISTPDKVRGTDCRSVLEAEYKTSERSMGTRRSNLSKSSKSAEEKVKPYEVLSENDQQRSLKGDIDFKCKPKVEEVSEKLCEPADATNEPLKLAFDKLKDHYDSLPLKTLYDEIIKRGICPNEDERLTAVRDAISKMYKDRRITDIVLNYQMFKQIGEPVSTLLLKIIHNNLALQNIEEWAKCLTIYHRAIKEMTGIELSVSLTSADGQRLRWGPTKRKFPLKELLHLITYLMAIDSSGFLNLHDTIGLEINSSSFEWNPVNPLQGAGALAVVSHIISITLSNKTSTERHEKIRKLISNLTGGAEILFDSTTYVSSEKKSEYFKAALNWMKGCNLPGFECKDVDRVVQFYLESSSLQIDSDALSILGATLSNGGVCATTGHKIFCGECVEKVLSTMTISSSRPGVPMISSSSGAALVIVPAVMGLAVQADDPSASGFFVSAAFRHFALNLYERTFLMMGREKESNASLEPVLFAAARTGDILTLASVMDAGVLLGAKDYMSRTALHVAAASGHTAFAQILVSICPRLVTARDLTGNTPLDEARFFNHSKISLLLEAWDAVSAGPPPSKSLSSHTHSITLG